MIIALDDNEQATLLKYAHDTKYSTGRIAHVIESIYEANFEADIQAAIEHIEEVEESN